MGHNRRSDPEWESSLRRLPFPSSPPARSLTRCFGFQGQNLADPAHQHQRYEMCGDKRTEAEGKVSEHVCVSISYLQTHQRRRTSAHLTSGRICTSSDPLQLKRPPPASLEGFEPARHHARQTSLWFMHLDLFLTLDCAYAHCFLFCHSVIHCLVASRS